MMTEKKVSQMIELAAKAAGIEKVCRKSHVQDRWVYPALDYNSMSHTEFDPWNHNGDSFCLATLLDMDLIAEGVMENGRPCVSVLFNLPKGDAPWHIEVLSEPFDKLTEKTDPTQWKNINRVLKLEAYRHVITKAAAMIAEAM